MKNVTLSLLAAAAIGAISIGSVSPCRLTTWLDWAKATFRTSVRQRPLGRQPRSRNKRNKYARRLLSAVTGCA